MKSLIKNNVFTSVAAVLLYWVYQQAVCQTSFYIAGRFSYQKIDEYGVFTLMYVHHIVQLIFGSLAVLALSRLLKLDFKFSIGDKRTGLRFIGLFVLAIIAYEIIIYIIGYAAGLIVPYYNYPLTAKIIVPHFAFQLFMTGPSEEIIFRALPLTLFTRFFRTDKTIRLWKLQIPISVIIAAFIFSAGHVYWRIGSTVVSFDLHQLIFAFFVGVAYGMAYIKGKSVLYPMVMHCAVNVIVVGFGYGVQILMGL